MKRVEFDDLVARLEERYQDRTRELTRSSIHWAILGYLVLTLGLLITFGVVAGCAWAIFAAPSAVTVKLGLVLGFSCLVIGVSILRGCWVRLPPPEGVPVNREIAPKLFELIEQTSASAGGVKFSHVLLTDEFNASVVQIPRLGIFGWHKTYLSIGLQLLDSVTAEEFHAILAHEFAHLSKAHGRTSNWLYRIRQTWTHVAESLAEQGGLLVRPFHAFFNWFWPRFNARAFVLSRHNEYEADAFAASATSNACMASALQRISVEDRRLSEEFWEQIGKRTATDPEPPSTLYVDLSSFLKTAPPIEKSSNWIKQAFAVSTDTSDTHPSLRDRLAALGHGPEDSRFTPIEQSASEALLEDKLAARLRGEFSQQWRDNAIEHWKQTHAEQKECRDALEQLRGKEPTIENQREILRLRSTFEDMDELLPEIREWLSKHPDDLKVTFLLACHLASKDQPEGAASLEHVMNRDPELTFPCLDVLYGYYDRAGNPEKLRELKQAADEHESKLEKAFVERDTLNKQSQFEAHGLSPEKLEMAASLARNEKEVAAAWVAKKKNLIWPQWTQLVMVLSIKPGTLKMWSQQATQTLLERVAGAADLDAYVLVINDEGAMKAPAKTIKALQDSQIYDRKAEK